LKLNYLFLIFCLKQFILINAFNFALIIINRAILLIFLFIKLL